VSVVGQDGFRVRDSGGNGVGFVPDLTELPGGTKGRCHEDQYEAGQGGGRA
jgi:hypothetical protein